MLEKVQRRALGMVSNMRGRTYKDRLIKAGMTSLADRRARGDIITTYKIVSGKDKVDPRIFFDLAGEDPGAKDEAGSGSSSHQSTGSPAQAGYQEVLLQPEGDLHLEPAPRKSEGGGAVMAMMSGSAEGGWELNDREDRSQHSTQLK